MLLPQSQAAQLGTRVAQQQGSSRVSSRSSMKSHTLSSIPCSHSSSSSRSHPSVACRVLSPISSQESQKVALQVKQLRLLTAVKTPYLPNGKFDLPAYDAILEQQIANGVQGVIVGGTTGEGHLMSWDEHIMLIAHTVNSFGHQIAVVGNTGSNSTREALHATEQGFAVGMHAALQINPYYGKTSAAGLVTHLRATLDEGPAIIYNVPGRTGQDISDEVVAKVADHYNFLGMKECTGNARIASHLSHGTLCWSGNDDEAHDARHDAGAVGVISVTSNLIPGVMSKLMNSRDPELNQSIQALMSWLFSEPNPIPLNTAMAMCGLVKPVFRLPYVPMSKPQREEGAKLLRALQQHVPGCKEVRVMEDDEFKIIGEY